jgi:glycerol-3-phosphate acyltransferase PlsY
MTPWLGLVLAYVAGSIPFAYIAGRVLKGIDLRTVGSGNLGATNVFRTLGWQAAVAVLLLDGAKGALPAYWLPRILQAGELGSTTAIWWGLAYGVAAIVGHAKPVFLLWKGGGKGVATAGGVFLAMAPGPLASTLIVCAIVVALTGYMSVGSVAAAIAFPIWVWLDSGTSPVFWIGVAVGVFITWTHRTNYARLRAGTESKLFGAKRAGGKS